MKAFVSCCGLAFLSALTLVTPTIATAQDEWEEQVIVLIAVTAEALEEEGFELQDVLIGSLQEGEVDDVYIDLAGGVEHAIVGVCDADCTDFDIALINPDGEEVDRDVLSDDLPVVTVAPEDDGTYVVQFLMASCSEEPCRYGLASYAR